MDDRNGVELKLQSGDNWVQKALQDYEFRRDVLRQLLDKGREEGVIAYEKGGIYRVGGSIANAVSLLCETLPDGRYKYQVTPISKQGLLK